MPNNQKKFEEIVKNLSPKQRNLILEVVQNMAEKGGKTKAEMLKNAGYSVTVQETPKKAFGTKKIVEALENCGIDDDLIAMKQKSHLNARKVEKKDTFILWGDYEKDPEQIKAMIQEEIEEDFPGGRLLRLVPRQVGVLVYITAKISIPEYSIQDKAIDKVHKIMGNYAPEKVEHSGKMSLVDLFK